MINSVTQYIDSSADLYPNKLAYVDEKEGVSFSELKKKSRSIAGKIALMKLRRKPVMVYLDKSVRELISFFGILYSGNFYCPIDVDMPIERVVKICDTLNPTVVITDSEHSDFIKTSFPQIEILLYDEAIDDRSGLELLPAIAETFLDTDPAYVLFTSGSTGTPKGVLISHKSIIDFTEWMSECFSITSEDNFANQSPFHFDLSVGDIYCTLKCGCTNYIVPREYFVFPIKLIRFLNEKEISIIFWVPSALCLVANMRVFRKEVPKYLTRVLFCGEVMPNKQLNVWREALPDVVFANLYGPSETTDASTYYIVDRQFEDDESLPIGYPCKNTGIYVLNEKNELVSEGEVGELCISGIGLALGYYNDPKRTEEAFVQNPLNTLYPERIYRTGDLVKYNEFGELMYVSRKDFQIKHMGHRIELGEIETALGSLESVDTCACIYDDEKKAIVLFYIGTANEDSIKDHLGKKVPDYMIPGKIVALRKFPYNANGKIDRKALREMYKGGQL